MAQHMLKTACRNNKRTRHKFSLDHHRSYFDLTSLNDPLNRNHTRQFTVNERVFYGLDMTTTARSSLVHWPEVLLYLVVEADRKSFLE